MIDARITSSGLTVRLLEPREGLDVTPSRTRWKVHRILLASSAVIETLLTYSTVMLAALMIGHHLSISAL